MDDQKALSRKLASMPRAAKMGRKCCRKCVCTTLTTEDAIVDNIKQEALESMKDLLGGSQIGSALINGSTGVDVSDDALDAGSAIPIPSIPF